MSKYSIVKTVMEILRLGCGETYCESLNPFNDRRMICGEKGYLCYRCENRINMINKNLDALSESSEVKK